MATTTQQRKQQAGSDGSPARTTGDARQESHTRVPIRSGVNMDAVPLLAPAALTPHVAPSPLHLAELQGWSMTAHLILTSSINVPKRSTELQPDRPFWNTFILRWSGRQSFSIRASPDINDGIGALG
ncbi:hypothetical protein M8818_000438 [Zalaria obscura]|uniref:Uncharacterized protein n=1 Tax=Zalaria obscura TaxID=2024903 RepID=A0ACC3SPQ7_9PEZI